MIIQDTRFKIQDAGLIIKKIMYRTSCIVHLAVVLLLIPSNIFAKTLVVGDEYLTIGDAIKQAKEGDLVEVRRGRYHEKLRIEKAIHLKGIDSPVISTGSGNLIEIYKSGVVIEGFTLTYEGSELSSTDTAIYIGKGVDGVIVRNNSFLDVMFGIWNVEGRNIKIENNIVIGIKGLAKEYRGNCINLTGSQGAHISNNTLSYCRDGIYMELCHDSNVVGNEIKESRYSVHTMWVDRGTFNKNIAYNNLVGLAIMYTKHSEIKDNLSYGNQTHGILFIQSVRSEIAGNTVIGNTKGIFLYNSVYNNIKSNLVMNNQLGIHNWGGQRII